MSKIINTEVQLKGDSKPTDYYALVFPDVITPDDFIPYRNALVSTVKNILACCDNCDTLSGDMFWLLQLAEFITAALEELETASKNEEHACPCAALKQYRDHISRMNNMINQALLNNPNNDNNNEQQQ